MDIGFWVLFLGFLAWCWFGHRPSVDRFVSRHAITVTDHDRPSVDRVLRGTYRGRVIGALLGALVLGAAALTIGTAFAVVGAFAGLISGSMVGIALAQHRRRLDPDAVRHASLEARTTRDYTTRRGAWWIAAVSTACVLVAATVALTAPIDLGPFAPVLLAAVASVLIVPIGVVLQRRIVEAPRHDLDPRVDDVLRSTAVRAVHHSVLGVLLCGLALASFAGCVTTFGDGPFGDGAFDFTIVPANTTVPAERALIQSGRLRGPIRVSWTDPDGSKHQSEPFYLPKESHRGSAHGLGVALVLFGFFMLAAAIVALVQWWRATTSWRRPAARPGSETTLGRAGIPA